VLDRVAASLSGARNMASDSDIALLKALFDRAVAVADPMACVPQHLPRRPDGRVVVVGAGKASARMAEAVETVWGPQAGIVITRDGHARATAGIEIVEAAHPVPDARGVEATRRILGLVDHCRVGDLVVALISGGGSALMVQPAGAITLAEKQAITNALLDSGAPIAAINTVRKHLSRVKGGQLAARAAPARVFGLLMSDVPGDVPADIASGPTVGEVSTQADARAILARYDIPTPESVAAVLRGPSLAVPPGHTGNAHNRIVAAPAQSLEAAAEMARGRGCRVEILGDAIEGEARAVAADHAAQARAIAAELSPGAAPVLLLSGGECTVTRTGAGRGGPNAEYALALALALDGAGQISAIACDTDGVDGNAEVAGAIVGPSTLRRADEAGVDAAAALADNDAHGFFGAIGDRVITGPTLTNVNDFRAILINPPQGR
jgi:glycerate 2-kinase